MKKTIPLVGLWDPEDASHLGEWIRSAYREYADFPANGDKAEKERLHDAYMSLIHTWDEDARQAIESAPEFDFEAAFNEMHPRQRMALYGDVSVLYTTRTEGFFGGRVGTHFAPQLSDSRAVYTRVNSDRTPGSPGETVVSGKLTIRCTGNGSHGSKEIATGAWVEIGEMWHQQAGNSQPTFEGSFSFWSEPFPDMNGVPRYRPMLSLRNTRQGTATAEVRLESSERPEDWEDGGEDKLERGMRLNLRSLKCPRCRTHLTATPEALLNWAYVRMIQLGTPRGRGLALDISKAPDMSALTTAPRSS